MNKLHRILYIIYVVLVVLVFAYGLYNVAGKDETAKDLIAFDDDWKTEGGRTMNITDMPRMEAGEKTVLTRQTPTESDAGDVWNLVSHNIYFEVYVNGRLVYDYHPGENITGKGYGDHIHHILFRPAGSVIKLVCEPIYGGEGSGFFKESYVGTTTDFNSFVFKEHGFSFMLSVLIIIFGILVFVMFISSIGLKNTNYHMPALSMAVIIGGVWSAVPTLVPHILIHNQLIIRAIDYSCLTFIGFPIVVFVNSVTENRRRIFELISFGITVICAFLMYGLRIFAGIDLHKINFFNIISCAGSLIVLLIIIADDWIEHKKHSHKTLNRALYFGSVCLVIGSCADLYKYIESGKKFISNGAFMQIGFIIFILVMIVQAQRRMMMEHERFDNQQFVNNLLKYSFSGQSPEVIINQMLAYLGEETGADRAYIFEDNFDGTFDNTYEWCREGVNPEIDNLKKIPFTGAVQLWYEQFHQTGYQFIEDLEKYKEVSEKMYAILKPQNIHSLITSPLEKDNGYIGFFGVDNPPAEKAKELTSILRLLGFFFVVIMRQRDAQQQLIKYSYIDSLTGVSNRRSLDEMKEKMEQSENSYGILMCDINGLKRMNDEKGHDAGDQLIVDVADCLKEVFGDRRVFRMGGDEFLVIREGGSRDQFALAVREVRDMIEKKGRSVSTGTAFSSEGFTFDALMRMADERMYDDKRRYYEQHGTNRRRR